jgi:hypothetical protein
MFKAFKLTQDVGPVLLPGGQLALQGKQKLFRFPSDVACAAAMLKASQEPADPSLASGDTAIGVGEVSAFIEMIRHSFETRGRSGRSDGSARSREHQCATLVRRVGGRG